MRRGGLAAEFETPERMLGALRALRSRGLDRLDTYTPYPMEEVDEVLGLRRTPVAQIVLAGGLAGASLAYLMQWYVNASNFPLIVGARPPHAAPAFLLITFELGVLGASVAALVAALALGRMPRLWDPMFEVEGFASASIDRFWLSVDARDPKFDAEALRTQLLEAGALRVRVVEDDR